MDVCVSLYVLDMALFWEIHLACAQVLEIVTMCDLFVYLGGHKLFTAEKRNKSQLKRDRCYNEDERTRRYEGGWVWRSGIVHQKQLILHSRWKRVQAGRGTGSFTRWQKDKRSQSRRCSDFLESDQGRTRFIPNLLMSPPFLLTIKMQFTPWYCTSNLCKVCK